MSSINVGKYAISARCTNCGWRGTKMTPNGMLLGSARA